MKLDVGTALIVMPDLRLDNVSATPGAVLLGPPGPTAFLGLGHRIQRDLSATGIDVTVSSVAFIVHEWEVAAGHRRIPVETRSEADNRASAMIDAPEGYLRATLILVVESKDTGLVRQAADYLHTNVLRYRLGGGRFVNVKGGLLNRPVNGETVLRNAVACCDDRSFRDLMKVIPPGFVLIDRSDILAQEGEADGLDRVLNAVSAKLNESKEKKKEDGEKEDGEEEKEPPSYARNTPGWIVPVLRGWRALSPVAMRQGMRDGDGIVGHIYAEDVLGLAEWVSIKRAFRAPDALSRVAWRYSSDHDIGFHGCVKRGI